MPIPKPERFARIPASVYKDKSLTITDFRVYCQMATLCINTNIVSIGQRKLSEIAGFDRRNLRRSLESLGAKGHISRAINPISNRTVYQLNSTVFLATAQTPASYPKSTGLRLVEKRKSKL